MEEIAPFCQDNLDKDDMMILDVFSKVYVWAGTKANEAEKKKTLEVAMVIVLFYFKLYIYLLINDININRFYSKGS